VLILFAAFVII